MILKLSARKILRITLFGTGLLVALHILGLVISFGWGVDNGSGIIRLFNMEYERNIPTIWSGLLLVYAAFLLFGVARLQKRVKQGMSRYWALLGVVFLYLSADEVFELHELAHRPLRHVLAMNGVAYFYAWIFPAALALLILGAIYLRFLVQLPRQIRNLFIISCALYAGSAILFEIPEAIIHIQDEWMSLSYAVLVTFEEALEMSGVCLFAYAVIRFASLNQGDEEPVRMIQWYP